MKIFFFFITLLLVGCSGFHGFTFRSPGDSMAPTVKAGDSIFANPIYYKYSPVRRGDIVVVKDPDGKMYSSRREEMYIRRVIGLGGDKIQVKDGKVYVNDRLLSGVLGSGKYATAYPVEDYGPIIVPTGEYFLVGDNLANSYDSRSWKHPTVKIDGIYGKVTMIKDGESGEMHSL